MIFIVVKWRPKTEYLESFPEAVAEFTEATRAEPGNLFFDWSRSLDDPAEYVLVEGFRDGEAGSAHVTSAHFEKFVSEAPALLSSTPLIISQTVDATGWSQMGEMQVP